MFTVKFQSNVIQKRVIIALDLKANSENLALFVIKFLEGIPCHFNLLHILESDLNDADATSKMESIANKMRSLNCFSPKSTVDYTISKCPIAHTISKINDLANLDLLFLGTSNSKEQKELGSTATEFFIKVRHNIMTVPPQLKSKSISNINILIEKDFNSIPFYNSLQRFLKCKDVFINLLYIKNGNIINEEDKTIIKKHQELLKENFAFPILYNSSDIIDILFQHLANNHTDLLSICCSEGSKYCNYIENTNYSSIPVSNTVPIFFSKLKVGEKQFADQYEYANY